MSGNPITASSDANVDQHFDQGEAQGKYKSRFDIPKLYPNYIYTIQLFAKTSAGLGLTPATINASTISFDDARPLVPVKVNITQVLGVTNISWSYQNSQFSPDNYTLMVSFFDIFEFHLFHNFNHSIPKVFREVNFIAIFYFCCVNFALLASTG